MRIQANQPISITGLKNAKFILRSTWFKNFLDITFGFLLFKWL